MRHTRPANKQKPTGVPTEGGEGKNIEAKAYLPPISSGLFIPGALVKHKKQPSVSPDATGYEDVHIPLSTAYKFRLCIGFRKGNERFSSCQPLWVASVRNI